MFGLFKRFYQDESGEISAAGMLLLVTIVGIGGVVGLVAFRNQVVQELGDTGVALTNLDQSFSYTITVPNGPPITAMYPPPAQNPMLSDTAGSPPGCINVNCNP